MNRLERRLDEAERGVAPRGTDLLLALTVALTAVVIGVAVANEGLQSRYLAAAISAAGVIAPLTVGAYALRRVRFGRFGYLLVLVGVGTAFMALSNSGSDFVYSVGRIAGWLLQPLVIYALLSFPTGRLTHPRDRFLVSLSVAVVLALYVPSAFFVDDYPVPTPWTTCTAACPANAFQVTGAEPGFTDGLVVAREIITFAVFIAVSVALVLKVRRASSLERSVLSPVLGIAVLRFLLFATAIAVRVSAAPDNVAKSLSLVGAMTLPLISVAFLVGLLRLRLKTGSALEQINRRMHAPTDPLQLQDLLARTLGDPALRLYLARPGPAPGWQNAAGRVAGTPEPGPGRVLARLPAQRGSGAAMLDLDEVLAAQPTLVEAAAGSVQAMLERQRLTTALQASLHEVDESRARLLAAGDEERRRIERDLHDGAQQRLIAIRIRLGLAEERLNGADRESAEVLRGLGDEVDRVIDEIRNLSRGIYPALLADAGPVEALRAAARDSPVPVTVTADEVGRTRPEVENAIYFACLEAIQNAVKHGEGATRIEVRITDGDSLRFDVSDDGRADDTAWLSAEAAGGAGLTNMRDRIAALGGELTVDSRPGAGTTVRGVIPL